jgi:hypothetical protein
VGGGDVQGDGEAGMYITQEVEDEEEGKHGVCWIGSAQASDNEIRQGSQQNAN